MVTSTVKLNARQFLHLNADPPGARLELVQGEIAVSPSPTPEHSHVVAQLTTLLVQHVREEELGIVLGDLDTILSDYDVRRPDIGYFAKKRMHLIESDEPVEAVPDLCIEVLSPSSITTDRVDKFNQYQEAGVGHYWIVDPRGRRIEVYHLRRGKYVLAGEAAGTGTASLAPFPKLQVPLHQLWWPSPVKGQKRRT